MIKINEKKRLDLFPYYGKAFSDINEIWIREDINKYMKYSLYLHEIYHLSDKETNVYLRELKAVFLGQIVYPFVGLFCVVFKTLFSIDRLKLCLKRFWRK